MSEPKSREGTMFGPYRLLRLIGKGGMGEVYEAEDTVKDRIVALKLLPEGVSHDPVFRKRLQREAHSAGRLQEPHVVPIHDYGEIDGVLFVDMRMINGSDLRKMLKNFGPMTPARAVAIVRQIASALDAAHESGIMHRDVKPENILITRDDFAYLVDFGIANAASDEKLTELGTAVGTYAYMAPERFTSDEVTYRADVYALACVLHECLTGSQPFAGDSVSVVITAHLMQPIPRPSVDTARHPAGLRPGDRPRHGEEARRTLRHRGRSGDGGHRRADRPRPGSGGDDPAARRGRHDAGPSVPIAPMGATHAPPRRRRRRYSPRRSGRRRLPATVRRPPPPPPVRRPPPAYGTATPPPYGAPAARATAAPAHRPRPAAAGIGHPPARRKSCRGCRSPSIGAQSLVLVACAPSASFLLARSDEPTDGPTVTDVASRRRRRASGRRPRAPAAPTDADADGRPRTRFDAQLMALIPPGLPDERVRGGDPAAPGALATVDCRQVRRSPAVRTPRGTRSSPNMDR